MIRRYAESALLASLKHFPAVLVTGARQVGKSTLVQSLCRSKWKADYVTLDDRNRLDAALQDPDGFLNSYPTPLAIDEVQHAPDLLRAIKLNVDRSRKPGQFLLTGSANILTLKNVSETLAGRVALHELYPFSFEELSKKPYRKNFLSNLFERHNLERLNQHIRTESIQRFVLKGGYPTPSLSKSLLARSQWYEAYRKTYVERDIRDISAIERLPDFGRLMTLAAARSGQILNFSELARDSGLPYITLRRYVNILEQTYQTFLVQPFFTNASKRLMKAPKLYWMDTGMACHLLGIHREENLAAHPQWGALLESWVAAELKKLISIDSEPMTLYGWRTQSGQEIDFLIEKGTSFLAIEVKSGARVDSHFYQSFRFLETIFKDRLSLGIVLYGGQETVWLSKKAVAIPLSSFFLT